MIDQIIMKAKPKLPQYCEHEFPNNQLEEEDRSFHLTEDLPPVPLRTRCPDPFTAGALAEAMYLVPPAPYNPASKPTRQLRSICRGTRARGNGSYLGG